MTEPVRTVAELLAHYSAQMKDIEKADDGVVCTCKFTLLESGADTLELRKKQAMGLLVRFTHIAEQYPDAFAGKNGTDALNFLLAGFNRLNITLSQLNTTAAKLQDLLPNS